MQRPEILRIRVGQNSTPMVGQIWTPVYTGTHMADIDGAWQTIRARAGLHDVRIHDIRHSFASRALALGEGLPIIGRLLGHRRVETTARYAHLAHDSVRESAERIASSIAADIL